MFAYATAAGSVTEERVTLLGSLAVKKVNPTGFG
jgi:hypothetical protein